MGFFTIPLALIGLASLPVLGGIYWLRNRFRRQQVSSLVLWTQYSRPKEGGRKLQNIQTPLLFFLELLILALLVFAATRPMVPGRNQLRHLLIVLDDSYSMQAIVDGQSVREAAVDVIAQQMGRFRQTRTRFIRAGVEAQVLGPAVQSMGEACLQLKDWTCEAPQADIEKALALARELSHTWTDILVITDHAPPHVHSENSSVVWRALGQAQANPAIVHAARSDIGDSERLLVEVKDAFGKRGACALQIVALPDEGEAQVVAEQQLTLRDGRTQRLIINLKAGLPNLQVQIKPTSPDSLAIDNQALLLSQSTLPVRVRLYIKDEGLRRALEEVLTVSGRAKIVNSNPELFISDSAGRPTGLRPAAWSVQFCAYDEAVTYTGPYSLDASETLTEGVSLSGVLWGAGKPTDPNEDALRYGKPIILAGSVPLMTLQPRPGRGAHVAIRLNPVMSTLFQSPNWPIIVQNLLDTVTWQRSGPLDKNVRLGSHVTVNLPPGTAQVQVVKPGQTEPETLSFLGGDRARIQVPAERCGIYSVTALDNEGQSIYTWPFAVNTLLSEESDLSAAVTEDWGDWTQSESTLRVYTCLAGILLMIALAVLVLHLVLIGRKNKGGEVQAWA